MMQKSQVQTEQLLLICNEIIADGVVTQTEIHKLRAWLNENKSALESWPGNVIAEHINGILADGKIDDTERESLCGLLNDLIQGNPGIEGLAKDSLCLDCDNPVPLIAFREKVFFFLGKFYFGSLKKCQAAVISLEGFYTNTPSAEIDYVVIGAQNAAALRASPNQVKIEKMLLLKKRGYKFAVISEENWIAAISRSKEPQDLTERAPQQSELIDDQINPSTNCTDKKRPPIDAPIALSLTLPIDDDEYARKLNIESSSGEESYIVDLSIHTCSCPDFIQKRTVFPMNDASSPLKNSRFAVPG